MKNHLRHLEQVIQCNGLMDRMLCYDSGEPVGVDAGEAFGGFDLGVAVEDGFAVLVDVPAYVYAEHRAAEGVHKGEQALVAFSFAAVEVEG